MGVIRNAAKALIFRDGCLLAMRMRDEQGDSFILPGGGQEPGETLVDAVRRECAEDIGADVAVHELCHIRERVAEEPHRVEFTFRCTLLTEPGVGTLPDDGQVGLTWLPLAQLAHARFYPLGLRPLLGGAIPNGDPIYLGDLP